MGIKVLWRLGRNYLNYSPSNIFETFPFPNYISYELEKIGQIYWKCRKQLMPKIHLGLTKTYNLFHKPDLKIGDIEKASKQETAICEVAYEDILSLRQLHKQMDEAVLEAYGWQDIDHAHDFYEVDYLPENDCIRYTISSPARKEVLKRLLKLNHEIHAKEVEEGKLEKDNKKGKLKVNEAPEQYKLNV